MTTATQNLHRTIATEIREAYNLLKKQPGIAIWTKNPTDDEVGAENFVFAPSLRGQSFSDLRQLVQNVKDGKPYRDGEGYTREHSLLYELHIDFVVDMNKKTYSGWVKVREKTFAYE